MKATNEDDRDAHNITFAVLNERILEYSNTDHFLVDELNERLEWSYNTTANMHDGDGKIIRYAF